MQKMGYQSIRIEDLPWVGAVSSVGTACVWPKGTSSLEMSAFGAPGNLIK